MVEEQNWSCLVGLPESALNNLAARFDENIVPHLPDFLRQNWAIALYHDRFAEFRMAMRKEMECDADFVNVLSATRSTTDNALRQADVNAFLAELPAAKSGIVRRRLRDFIQTNKYQLDMYYVPSLYGYAE